MAAGDDSEITELIGVYHADGGLLGELSYVVGKLRGTAHCGLCDITHRGLGRKPEWDRMVQDSGVPFTLLHRNECDEPIRAACSGRTPCVLARTGSGLTHVLGAAELDACGKDVTAFKVALTAALTAHGFRLPDRPLPGQDPPRDHPADQGDTADRDDPTGDRHS
ncbi:hypothetical protein [Stackebrandtia albiflava]|nr:hypothetical protein [Stackebrandtia albiflava]